MRLIFRLLVLLVVLPAAYLFTYLVPFSFIPFTEQRWIPSSISLLVAVGVGWYVWKALGATELDETSSTYVGAIVVGAIGFCAGYFGPPSPLLGIFVTGPLGFVLGAIGGYSYWLIKKKKDAR
jgi:flagellar biosynthesis protein FliR